MWCLTKPEADKFKKALKDGSIHPDVLSKMSSEERNVFFQKFTNADNATRINSLFESKLLLKNQKRGFISWAKKISNISPATKYDLVSRIERMDKVLSTAEQEQFLRDLATTRLKVGVTRAEAKEIFDLSKKASESRKKADENGNFPSEQDRLQYGMDAVNLENYVNELKRDAKEIRFSDDKLQFIKEKVIIDLPGTMKSLVSSLDNSFFGRQGIKTLLDFKTSKIWVKSFLKSWKDIGLELRGKDAINLIKADIYSRPNALNGKYDAGDYSLNVLNEEAFPTSIPERIPLFGRLFKASESAYSGGALRMRADLADRMIKIAEDNGVNTLNRDEARGLGRLVSSMTGRGSIGKFAPASKEINVILFSIRFVKSNFDTLTAHMTDPVVRKNKVARKEASQSLLRIIATTSLILMIAKMFNPDDVDEDPRSANFGKIRIFNKWTDITGGMGALVRLAFRIMPSYHDGQWGQWSKSSTGNWTNLREGGFGSSDAWDLLVNDLFNNKLSPVAQLFKGAITGEFFGGEKFTPSKAIYQGTVPLSIQSLNEFMNDPTAEFVLGSMIFEGLGFSVSSYPEPNEKSKAIPTDTPINNESFINVVMLYARALGTDPETAFNRIFTNQRIVKISNDAIIVERMPVGESQKIKAEANAKNPEMKLDHTIPLGLGGSNDRDNLKIVTTKEHASYTKIENILIKALKEKRISKEEAQKLIVDFKNGKVSGTSIQKKYGK